VVLTMRACHSPARSNRGNAKDEGWIIRSQPKRFFRARTSNWCALRTWPSERKRSA